MNEPIAIPSIVSARWQEALARPSIGRWRSLAQMLASMVVNASVYTPGSPIVGDLRTLAHVAHTHMLSLQPELEEAAA
ncbi:hypothetical protein [Thiobacillus sp.]|uniref:hypothetical protein n=1 Tax=Thiobacillus sp. TaxID=924 RepID=UPI0017AD5CBC|nr:hypothetical protein [Thiobacillus sp.]MBC2731355.1 hypothetical protein [Thiobacillus sp.]MBC2740091.1 hypothetical protein [Thiobacillus sp.]MBC2758303.1 hypothetical protein [Thiobacillus sp.]